MGMSQKKIEFYNPYPILLYAFFNCFFDFIGFGQSGLRKKNAIKTAKSLPNFFSRDFLRLKKSIT